MLTITNLEKNPTKTRFIEARKDGEAVDEAFVCGMEMVSRQYSGLLEH